MYKMYHGGVVAWTDDGKSNTPNVVDYECHIQKRGSGSFSSPPHFSNTIQEKRYNRDLYRSTPAPTPRNSKRREQKRQCVREKMNGISREKCTRIYNELNELPVIGQPKQSKEDKTV
jgi:hypothetical protein